MKNLNFTHKHAFTMIELVFVIVILGILAAMALPRLERDIRQEAADNILSSIRYTQQLALIDNKTSTNNNWLRTLWAIRFTTGANAFYTIGTDDNNNSAISKYESAIDPTNSKFLYNSNGAFVSKAADESPNIFLGYNYGINTIGFTGGCTNTQKHVAFDHLGRPFNGIGASNNTYNKIMHTDCTITFTFDNADISDLKILIEKQTGYAHIIGQDNS